MRKFHYFFTAILGLCSYLPGQAADPFDRTQRQSELQSETRISTRTAKCSFNEPIFAVETAFEQLKLVGVVMYKQVPEALFLDDRQQLIIAKQGHRLGRESYLLQQIGKNGVRLLRPKAGQCEQTESLDVRF